MGGVKTERPWVAWIDWSPALPAALVVVQVASIIAGRLLARFDLEWMEGGMLVHALRLSRGQPLYIDPSAQWIPYVYPPGYAAVVAAAGSVFGLDYPVGRAVSVLGILAAMAASVAFGRRSGNLRAGLFGAVVLLGTYPQSGAFFDLVRPDGLSAGLLAWTLYLATDRRRGTAAAAGLLLAAAFVVKHHVALLGLPLALLIWSRESWRRGLVFGLCAAVPAGTLSALLEWRSGHFVDYLLRVPSVHPHDWERLFPGVPGELAAAQFPALVLLSATLCWWLLRDLPRVARLGGACLVALTLLAAVPLSRVLSDVPGVADAPAPFTSAAVCLVLASAVAVFVHLAARRFERRSPDGLAVGAALVGSTVLLMTGIMRSHNGGFSNVLIPSHLLLALGVPLVDGRWRTVPQRVVVALALWAQFVLSLAQLDREHFLPTADDHAAHARLVATIRDTCEGEVFSPYAPWLAYQAGREPGFQLIALWDVSHPTTPVRGGPRDVTAAANEHRWGCVVLPSAGRKLGYGVDAAYADRRPVPMSTKAMMPKTGWRVRPSILAFPKAAPAASPPERPPGMQERSAGD